MKSYKEIAKKYKPEEIAQSFVFPDTSGKKEAKLEAFQQFRQKADAKRTEKDKIIAQLLQLKFQIEDYINTEVFNKSQHFGFFLKEYIERLEKKNKEFASEIDIDPTELSQIINKHRAPTEKLIIRLEIHSNKSFPAIMWFKLIEKEKAYELIHDKEIRNRESKHVKQKSAFSL
ncbi:helix-turn-helix protein [Chitinophaga niastensis]|uniref:Helix-turn-helix protein n=1 Tax=Chitinophaga niastensis TaxID=536980 RepID=A0A2P8HR52_CHINA|nr:helix-turn-helix domain-containing protein [Chitinophaga niastensis]PSL48707.1 helix-turn-helix protein [Chitinophaga niastensis]